MKKSKGKDLEEEGQQIVNKIQKATDPSVKKKLKIQERKVELNEEDFQDDFGGRVESHYKDDGVIDKVIVPRQEDEEEETHKPPQPKNKKNKKVKKF